MSNRLYPLFVKLEGRFCLVIGGRHIATRKISALRDAGASVTVISPDLDPRLQDLTRAGLLRWVPRKFEIEDLGDQFFLVIVATDNAELSAQVFESCERRGILCSAADDDEHCNFHSPAVAERGDIKVAVSTSGKSPAFAAEIRTRIENVLTEEDAVFLEELGRIRTRVQKRYSERPKRRQTLLRRIVAAYRRRSPSVNNVHSTENPSTPDASPESARQVSDLVDRETKGARGGTVYLVGAGPGALELMTLRAATLLLTADVIYYDRLVGNEIIERLPDSIEKIYVGKEAGQGYPVDIKTCLVESAREGKAVVRLKGGDPNLYGRGGEEMVALLAHNIPTEVVPGVSALTAAPSAAGIPVTYRDLANQVVVRSGYRLPDLDSETLARSDPKMTTFVYFMTVGRLTEIVKELLERDQLAPDTPIAIVQKGTLPDQKLLRGTLGDIIDKASRVALHPPALVVVGDVVRFADRDSILSFLNLESASSPGHDPDGGDKLSAAKEENRNDEGASRSSNVSG